MRLFGSITNFAITLSVVVLVCGGCADDPDAQNAGAGSGESHEHGGERHEHDGDGEGHHDKEGEESGTQYTLDQQYDETRHGARLVLAYNKDANSFVGTVENTTEEVLEQVRVEVHLSNGKELGPTTPGDMQPREKRDIVLAAESTDFETWSAHPEVGRNEHGSGGEHDEGNQ